MQVEFEQWPFVERKNKERARKAEIEKYLKWLISTEKWLKRAYKLKLLVTKTKGRN